MEFEQKLYGAEECMDFLGLTLSTNSVPKVQFLLLFQLKKIIMAESQMWMKEKGVAITQRYYSSLVMVES